MELNIEQIVDLRVRDPEQIKFRLQSRKRRPLMRDDGNLFILAADHPARGALSVGDSPTEMADRYDLLERFSRVLPDSRVDGVLGTPDLLEDLVLLGLLEDKIAIGSMNRGGLRGSVFEYDDRFTAFNAETIREHGFDFAKTLLRINLGDAATARTLEENSRAVNECAALGIPILLEPFMSEWAEGLATNILTTEAVELSVNIASGLGATSAYTWLKLPVVPNMERVVRATTLPILLLGGDGNSDIGELLASWQAALKLPGVRGLVVGRALLYPQDGNVEGAVAMAAKLVHP